MTIRVHFSLARLSTTMCWLILSSAEVASSRKSTLGFLTSARAISIEDVANVNMPNEFQLGVFPKEPSQLPDIIAAIYEAHPEFKMEKKSTGDTYTKFFHRRKMAMKESL